MRALHCLFAILAGSVLPLGAHATDYSDVPPEHWAYDATQRLAELEAKQRQSAPYSMLARVHFADLALEYAQLTQRLPATREDFGDDVGLLLGPELEPAYAAYTAKVPDSAVRLKPADYGAGRLERDGLRYELAVRSTQDRILAQVTVTNVSAAPIVLRFPTGKRADFWGLDAYGIVWDHNYNRFYSQTAKEQTLEPGKAFITSGEWEFNHKAVGPPRTPLVRIVGQLNYADGPVQVEHLIELTGQSAAGLERSGTVLALLPELVRLGVVDDGWAAVRRALRSADLLELAVSLKAWETTTAAVTVEPAATRLRELLAPEFAALEQAAALIAGKPGIAADVQLVPLDHWAYNALDYLEQQGVDTGMPPGTFRSGSQLTRAQFKHVLARALDWAAGQPELSEQLRVVLETLRAEFSDQLSEIP
jgi:hypothetical protein